MSRAKDGGEREGARSAREPSRLAIDCPLPQRLLDEHVLLGPLELLSHVVGGELRGQLDSGQQPTPRGCVRNSTYPGDNEIRGAVIDERAEAALEQRGDVVLDERMTKVAVR